MLKSLAIYIILTVAKKLTYIYFYQEFCGKNNLKTPILANIIREFPEFQLINHVRLAKNDFILSRTSFPAKSCYKVSCALAEFTKKSALVCDMCLVSTICWGDTL